MEDTAEDQPEPVREALAELLELARTLEELPLEEAEPAAPIPDWR